MTASLILHECQRRGLEIQLDGGGRLRCMGRIDDLTPDILALIGKHKAELAPLLLAREAEIGDPRAGISPQSSPLSPRPSPHKATMWTRGTHSVTPCIPEPNDITRERNNGLSPHSPHKSGETPHAIGREDIEENEVPPPREANDEVAGPLYRGGYPRASRGLSGLRPPDDDGSEQLISSPPDQVCGLRRGLEGGPCGLNGPGPADDWRRTVANLPHEEWVAWRRRSGELEPPDATIEEIREAERQAFAEITAERTRPDA
jgi:hypothetical protein